MKSSPIKLNNKSKSKLSPSKNLSLINKNSHIVNSRNNSPIHQLGPKLSPNRHRKNISDFIVPNSPSLANTVILRSGSKSNNQSPSKSLQKLANSKSFHQQFDSQLQTIQRLPQKSFIVQSPSKPNQSFINHVLSPVKVVENRCLMKNDQNRRVLCVDQIPATQRIVSPVKVVYKPSSRQVELERKCKILQMRINQLYSEKTMNQTQLNQAIIRLQYENNMLRQKINSIEQNNHKIASLNSKQCQQCRKIQENCDLVSQKLIKDLQKSQQNEYHQSKQIHSLKQKLSQTQELLSQQITKTLDLMQELKSKQSETKILNQQNQRLQNEIKSLTEQFHQIEGQSSQLLKEISYLGNQSNDVNVTKQLMNDLQQNNQLLISAIRNLQASLHQSHQKVQLLQEQKSNLVSRIQQIQESHQLWIEKDTYTLQQIEELTVKVGQIKKQLEEKNLLIEEKDNLISNQRARIQKLMECHGQQGEQSSTAGSFSKKVGKEGCNKCEQLRRTVIRLNSHLNTTNEILFSIV